MNQELIKILIDRYKNKKWNDAEFSDAIKNLRDAAYEAACILATHLLWDQGKCGGSCIIMLPSTTAQNSVYFSTNGRVQVIADQLFGTNESAYFQMLDAKKDIYTIMTKPSYSPLSSANTIMASIIAGQLFVTKSVTAQPIELSLSPLSGVCNFYQTCVNSYQRGL